MCVSIIKIYSRSAEQLWNYADPFAHRTPMWDGGGVSEGIESPKRTEDWKHWASAVWAKRRVAVEGAR